ncbi:carboxyl-terminal processing protease [Sedimentibacter acidaminivorans]|uniref:Carboxyl-terminal processing protease n=1 Tax=Sedimentibacter acidaminivorans TaxID=913099 RepID=A0ABS4GDW6_9FIRM|nr:S41 family peptidase [Sedimentibacter acidaminivorans]MBP1925839.1 carboxyl-terminal processing protease [Sedimentibacter acidaminivorans]
MISKKKYILTVVIAVFVTAFLSMTLGNVLMVEFGQKVVISEASYNDMKNIVHKYAKQESVMDYAKENFLYDADESAMLEGALKGTLNALGDPYTQFMTKEQFDALMQDTEGSYEGIGVYITASDDNKILIVSPIEDTPAEKAGLKTGDKIIRINGTDFSADEMDEAVKLMKGMPGTSVNLTILREDKDGINKTSEVVVNREKIKIKTIKPAMLENDIGYIRITTFDLQTADDFNKAYNDLKNQGMKGLVIDLRYNPGGIIDATVDITNKFLGEGIITYTKTKAGEMDYYKSDSKADDIPLVLLVNDGSASASEIMSGALKDTKRATLIGTKTFGKGIVQRVQKFGNDGEGIKMTISEYFTPNGINIHGIGIEPDIEVELPEDAVGYGSEYYDTDVQLQKAVEVINEKISQ